MARALLISNPIAARTDRRVLARVESAFKNQGWSVDVAETKYPGDATEIAANAPAVDVVAVYGGDGTVMQVVHGIIDKDVPLGLIPGGTGNLLAGNLRLPRNPEAAARTIMSGTRKRIDLGVVDRSGGPRYFAVASGAGYVADLMAGTPSASKKKWGIAAYVARAARTLGGVRASVYQITVDGVTSEVEAATVLVANCGEIIPPILSLGRGISYEDGLLNAVALRANGLFEAARVAFELLMGWGDSSPRVSHFRGTSIEIRTEAPRPVQMDGEEAGFTPFTARLLPGALQVIVPKD